ncbi:MAG: 2-hydroxyglutaryl-CoA dehydratase [Anaerovoracaceae bacterium]
MPMTFPHLGSAYLVGRIALKELGIPTIIPPVNSSQSLALGKSISPEEICLPFKHMAGNLIQAYTSGATHVVMPATLGPCRLGEYGELLKEVLSRNGYNYEWILIDTPKAIGKKVFIERIGQAIGEKKVSQRVALKILLTSVKLMKKLDKLEAKAMNASGYAKDPKKCIGIIRDIRLNLSKAESLKEGLEIIKTSRRKIYMLDQDRDKKPVRILLTGEIYTLIEPEANRQIEEKLMAMGCSVKKKVTISWWINHTIKEALLSPIEKMKKKSNYMPCSVGGYAKETVKHILETHVDGAIKVMPTGCMPEIVAKAVCNKIAKEQNLYILELVFDEMVGEAGYDTRIEAFVDMLERRKNVFSRN